MISIASVICGFAAVFFLSGFLEANRPALPDGYEDEDLALQGAKLKGYALGFEGLIADWYWMKSLQYIGDKLYTSKVEINIDNLKPLNPRLLYPYLDNATTLDPKFMGVYEYGATVLPAIDKEQAIAFTKKGIADNPNEWRLYQYLGFIYWRLGNYEEAAKVYEEGSQIAGAPDFMRLMAAKMKTKGGSREIARDIYRQMTEEAKDPQSKEISALRLLGIDSLDERDAIQQALDEFKLKNNRCPADWREIFPSLKNLKVLDGRPLRFDKSLSPIDPTDAPYLLKNQDGKCEPAIDLETSKLPVEQ